MEIGKSPVPVKSALKLQKNFLVSPVLILSLFILRKVYEGKYWLVQPLLDRWHIGRSGLQHTWQRLHRRRSVGVASVCKHGERWQMPKYQHFTTTVKGRTTKTWSESVWSKIRTRELVIVSPTKSLTFGTH